MICNLVYYAAGMRSITIKDYLYFNQQNNNALTSLAPKPIGKRQEYQYQREGELFR